MFTVTVASVPSTTSTALADTLKSALSLSRTVTAALLGKPATYLAGRAVSARTSTVTAAASPTTTTSSTVEARSSAVPSPARNVTVDGGAPLRTPPLAVTSTRTDSARVNGLPSVAVRASVNTASPPSVTAPSDVTVTSGASKSLAGMVTVREPMNVPVDASLALNMTVSANSASESFTTPRTAATRVAPAANMTEYGTESVRF